MTNKPHPPRVTVGQVWKRKNGTFVLVTEWRESRGLYEYLLVPIEKKKGTKSRSSWKWEAAIRSELTFEGNDSDE